MFFSILKEPSFSTRYVFNMVQMNLFAGQEGRERDAGLENGHVGTGWEGWGGMSWEIRTNVYTQHA